MSHRLSLDEVGDTLVELLATVVLMGLTIVFILGGIGEAVMLSGVHRNQADVSAALTSAAEFIKSQPYQPCNTAAGTGTGSSSPAASAFNTAIANYLAVSATTTTTSSSTTSTTTSSTTTSSTTSTTQVPLALQQQDVTVPQVIKVTDIGSGQDCGANTTDSGLELVAIQAGSSDGRVTQSIYVAKANR